MENFSTGQAAPATGTYTLVGHAESTTCQPTQEEKQIWLTAGDAFPPCKHCETDALWKM